MLNYFLIQHSYKRSGASLSTRIAPSIPSKSTPPEQPFQYRSFDRLKLLGLTGQLYSLIIILFRFDNIFIHLLWSCSTTFFLGQRRDDLSFKSKLIIIAAPKLASNRTPPEQSFYHIAPSIPSRSIPPEQPFQYRSFHRLRNLIFWQVSIIIHWMPSYFDSTIFQFIFSNLAERLLYRPEA